MIDPQWIPWSSIAIPTWLRWLGVAVVGGSGILLVWTFQNLGRNLTDTVVTRKVHSLVTAGPYRWVRHPMYTGFLALLAGGALVHNSGTALALLAVPFWGFFYWQSVVEERLLVDQLGDAYLQYRARTGRLLPRPLG